MSEPEPTPACPAAHSGDEWADYHAATHNLPPRPLLVEAVRLRSVPGIALDLGCGAGNDARYLVHAGYRVTAVDANLAAVRALQATSGTQLTAIQATFDEFAFDPDGYDLVNAQYALPFNPPPTFPGMFRRLVSALRPGGMFTGQLFGTRDAWNAPGSGMTFHTRDDAVSLFQDLELVAFREFDGPVTLANGQAHHGHAFDIIARRP